MTTAAAPPAPVTPNGTLTYTAALAAASARRTGLTGRLRECSGERDLVLACSVEQALPHVRSIANVERCQRKAAVRRRGGPHVHGGFTVERTAAAAAFGTTSATSYRCWGHRSSRC